MPIVDTQRFEGTLAGHGQIVPVGFEAMIDDEGTLHVSLNQLPFSDEAHSLWHVPEPTDPVDLLTLTGVATDGARFESNSFTIRHFNHGSRPGRELTFQGDCSDARITRTREQSVERSSVVWLVRQLRSIHRIQHILPAGRLVIGGADLPRESQQPGGFLHLVHPAGTAAESWWSEAEQSLVHVARVLSFACDSYLLPIIERRFHGAEEIIRVVRRGSSGMPFMPPFHLLDMGSIVACACDTYEGRREVVANIDPAIRWLTASIASWESRLVNALTALESILDRIAPDGTRLFQSGSAFKKLRKPLKLKLEELKAPPGMTDKLPELNRRSFEDQLNLLLSVRAIVTSDFPAGWLKSIIDTRNSIIHRGIVPAGATEEPDTLAQIVWAREAATRLILNAIGFEGAYQSWLHHDRAMLFPSCTLCPTTAASADVPALHDEPHDDS